MRARFVFAAVGEVSIRPGETGPIHVDGSIPAGIKKQKESRPGGRLQIRSGILTC